MARMLASNEDQQQCKINGLENHISFYTLCPRHHLIPHLFYIDYQHASWPRSSPRLSLAGLHVFLLPVFALPGTTSSSCPALRLRLARHYVFILPGTTSSPYPIPRLRLAGHCVFASPVALWLPSSPRITLVFVKPPSALLSNDPHRLSTVPHTFV